MPIFVAFLTLRLTVFFLFFFFLCTCLCAAFLSVLQSCYLPEELLEHSEMTNGAAGWTQNESKTMVLKCGWSLPKPRCCCLPSGKAVGRVNDARGTGARLRGPGGEVGAVGHTGTRGGWASADPVWAEVIG